MVNYEPELMYALDSKSEYADWKNVYNVSGSDVLYCPICLGRVKLWNGQDPNKAYKKQRCFHHIDGMCSQESRIHFAYKTWLLKQGSKFKVGETIYEVVNSEIEKTLHTKFGDYRPDITVETTEGKRFYIEIADTNKKTDDYIEKWDELGCDVLELDVNEQLIKATTAEIPEFDIIYSSSDNKAWNMDFHIDIFSCHCLITLSLLGYWSGNINLFIGDVDKKDSKIKDVIAKEMNRLYELGINGCHKYIPMFYSEIRIMEEC